MTNRFDALVIGGGPSGATAAILLAQADWSVVVVEQNAFPRGKVCGEYLSPTNMPLLDRLGVGDQFREQAGPEVRRVGLFAGSTIVSADLPRSPGNEVLWGRALSRQYLDQLMLNRAKEAGALVWQPCTATHLEREGADYRCEVRWPGSSDRSEIRAAVVIAAHGSWHTGPLPTQPNHRSPAPGDLFGFKAHFLGSQLPQGLMPLLIFPGGYGGMTHCEQGRVSLSCCVRRDTLVSLRAQSSETAGEVVLRHIVDSCRGVRETLAGANREGKWWAAGPIRPGLRPGAHGGIFVAGNAAGEAHPAIAEGISIAIQSSFLLAREVIAWGKQGRRQETLSTFGRRYSRAWRRAFAVRIRASSVIAHWGMRPAIHSLALPFIRTFPGILTSAARLVGKVTVCR